MSDKFLVNSTKEASYLLQGRGFGSIEEFDLFAYDALYKYIQDKERIKAIVKSKSFAYEVMFIKWATGTVFEDFICYFFDNLRIALKDHKEEILKLYVDSDLNIHEALVNYQDSAAMVNDINIENKRTKVKAGFNSIGDIIESSLYPQLKLLYGILQFSKKSSFYGKKTSFSNGRIVSELIQSSEVVEAVLEKLLINVPLNQWRNISNHASYKYNKNSDTIICEYGSKNQYSISVKYEEFFELFKSIDCIQLLLKTCLELSGFELCIKKEINNDDGRYELTKESIMSQVGNILAIFNYDVLSVDKVLNHWKINITDVNSLGINTFRELGNELGPYFLCMYKCHGLITELEVFDTKGRTFQKMSIGNLKT